MLFRPHLAGQAVLQHVRTRTIGHAFDKLYTPHSFFSAVMTAANIQLAASQINIPFIEAEENENPLRTELLKEPIEADAHMNYYVTDKPGLGVELDWMWLKNMRLSKYNFYGNSKIYYKHIKIIIISNLF